MVIGAKRRWLVHLSVPESSFRLEGPFGTMRWALWRRRSQTASATVGVADVVVPLGGRDLAGEDGGAVSVAVLGDLEEVAPLLVLGRGEAMAR